MDNFVTIKDRKIIETDYKIEYNKHYEGILTQGNGYFHMRGSFEEGFKSAPQNELYNRSMASVTTEVQRHKLSKIGSYLPRIMGNHKELRDVIINLPWFLGIEIHYNDERLDLEYSKIQDYIRVLDMANGVLTREFKWQAGGGAIRIKFERFASMSNKHLIVQKLTINTSTLNGELKIKTAIDSAVTTNGYRHYVDSVCRNEDCQYCKVQTDHNNLVEICSVDKFNISPKTKKRCDNIATETEYTFNCGEEKEITLERYTSICSDVDVDFNQSLNQNNLFFASSQGYSKLYEQNENAWATLWQGARVKVEGNEFLQNEIDFSVYHLLRCNTGDDERVQVCAKGFAGEAYYGRYFWDSEIYLLPFYLYTNPKAARNLLMYRYHTLNGARKNAKSYNLRGAKYPWQSGLTGEEQCSLWEYADNELHITCDVAFAVLHYYKATGDFEFIKKYGLEILLETSRFWLSRVDVLDDGSKHFLNIMGPDEYSPMTIDNGFTVRMIKENLNGFISTLNLLGDDERVKFMQKFELENAEIEEIRNLSNELVVPYDKEKELFLQSKDFYNYSPICLEDYWVDKRKAFAKYVTQEKIYRSRCIKQADVLAMMSLFPNEFTDKQVQTAYDFYMPITTHDSSLSPAVHALIDIRLNDENELRSFIEKAAAVDLSLDKLGGEDGVHIANCGAIWQFVVYGLMGFAPKYFTCENHCKVSLVGAQSISTTLVYNGEKHLAISQENLTEVLKLPKGLVFDLDGVITDTAKYHFEAWKIVADKLNLKFDIEMNEKLKGISRKESFLEILNGNGVVGKYSDDEIEDIICEKNEIYKQLISKLTQNDILEGILPLLHKAKSYGVKTAIASVSHNAHTIIQALGLANSFDYIADPKTILKSKPDKEIFVNCATNIGANPKDCIGFEDSVAGIKGIISSGMTSVGINLSQSENTPDLMLNSTKELNFTELVKAYNKKNTIR